MMKRKFVLYGGTALLIIGLIIGLKFAIDLSRLRSVNLQWEAPSDVVMKTPDGKPVLTVFDSEARPDGYIIRWGPVVHGTNIVKIWEKRVKGEYITKARLRCKPGLHFVYCTSYNRHGESDIQDILLFNVPTKAEVPIIESIKIWPAKADPTVVIKHESSTNGSLRVVNPADHWVQFAKTNAEANPAPAIPASTN